VLLGFSIEDWLTEQTPLYDFIGGAETLAPICSLIGNKKFWE
jgi:hypothetical protein